MMLGVGVEDIAVITCPMGPRFPREWFIAQDGRVSRQSQNFRIFKWEDIAGDRLLIDTQWNPRKIKAR